ncbi:MAG: Flp pilus assembly complex ATPase component TadA [Desulfobacula sp.]|uniref:GspE/PulE family protein n=1 Tax=Desulfobacula sp. TaxID=2593537 RepID=UPI0025C22DB5|nr:type II/IV secretion system protein [Desulfobacula sp.]MCD4721229.1 Flp pilus assembly complex ATPase component TadA [Desulfobacula sp.]
MATFNLKKKKRIGELAVDLGFMTEEQKTNILAQKNISGRMLGQLCVEEGLINDEQLAQLIAEQYSCKYARIDSINDPELLKMLSIDFIVKNRIVPFSFSENHLVFAVADPIDYFRVVEEIEILLEHDFSFVIVSSKKLGKFLQNMEASRDLIDVSEEMRLSVVKESDKGDYEISTEKVDSEESPVVKLVDSTILDAINKNASDIHFEGSAKGLIIRYRIDGMLHQITDPLDMSSMNPVISRLKVMSELDISEKRVPQDGRFKLKIKDRFVDFRISVLPTIFGEDAVIRILDQKRMAPVKGDLNLDGMGLDKEELFRLRRQIRAPYGMFLMTGPTGSGKTTTLYRALSEVNTRDTKIITIEDPVEYQLERITQIPVNDKKGLTFSRGLRSILRHDPDKILVGEIRDPETAQIALQSALTGHQVFATVHANSSFDVINRFIHMGIEPYNLVTALNCIVAQRLIRVLCHCRIKKKMSDKTLVESGLDPKKLKNIIFYDAYGCENCKGTGYSGRKAIIEHVELDGDMREMFIKQVSTSVLKKYALSKGVIFLRDAAINEVIRGRTTLEEANRVTFINQEAIV